MSGMRLTSFWHLVSTEATGTVNTVSERALGQGLSRTRDPHTTAVGLMPSVQVAVLALPIAQMEKLRPEPTRSRIKEEVNGCVANSSQNMIFSNTQCLLKFRIAPLILTSREKQWTPW